MEIEINNRRKLLLEFNDNKLVITVKNSKNEEEKVVKISKGDLVLLLDYYIYQKENGKEVF